jgi:hypothetical protein
MSSPEFDPALDTPIRGWARIARADGYVLDDGEPDTKAAQYARTLGRIDVTKEGTARGAPVWTTMRRLIAGRAKQSAT